MSNYDVLDEFGFDAAPAPPVAPQRRQSNASPNRPEGEPRAQKRQRVEMDDDDDDDDEGGEGAESKQEDDNAPPLEAFDDIYRSQSSVSMFSTGSRKPSETNIAVNDVNEEEENISQPGSMAPPPVPSRRTASNRSTRPAHTSTSSRPALDPTALKPEKPLPKFGERDPQHLKEFTQTIDSYSKVVDRSSGLDLEQRTQVLGNILDNTNRLLHQGAITDVSTAIVDLTLTKKVGKSLKEVAQQLSKNTQFSWNDIENKMKSLFVTNNGEDEGEKFDLASLGKLGASRFRTVYATSFLNVPLNSEQPAKERKKAQKFQKSEHTPQQKPVQAHTVSIPKTMTDSRVHDLLELIPIAPQKVMLFDALVHPTSFTQTVENFFDLTFLVKDSKRFGPVIIHIDADNLPYICRGPPNSLAGEEQQVMSHFIQRLDMKTWKHWIDVYKITKPFIPTRVVEAEDEEDGNNDKESDQLDS